MFDCPAKMNTFSFSPEWTGLEMQRTEVNIANTIALVIELKFMSAFPFFFAVFLRECQNRPDQPITSAGTWAARSSGLRTFH
jgi:hypothetical protein